MGKWLKGLVVVCACMFWVASVQAAHGGGAAGGGHGQATGGGGLGGMLPPPPAVMLKLILDHAADLNLTDEQKQKLAAIQKALPAQPDKPPAPDAEMKELMKKMRDAIKAGDKEEAAKIREQIAEKLKQLNPEGTKAMDAIKAVLTADQVAKLKELWKSMPKGHGAGGHGDQGGQGGQGAGKHGGGQGGQGGAPGGDAPFPF